MNLLADESVEEFFRAYCQDNNLLTIKIFCVL